MSTRGSTSVVAAAIVAWACSPSDAPRAIPTVLINNDTCQAGRCATLEIRAYVWKFLVPYPPQGEGLVGYAPPGQTCLTFPRSWTMTVTGPDSTGKMDTTITTWTPSDPSEIYLIALDSFYFHTALDSAQTDTLDHRGVYFDMIAKGSIGETGNFSVSSSPGWQATFPAAPPFTAPVGPTAICHS